MSGITSLDRKKESNISIQNIPATPLGSFSQLPQEIILKIFKLLSVTAIGNLAKTSTMIENHTRDNQLWSDFVKRDFSMFYGDADKTITDAKSVYQKNHVIKDNLNRRRYVGRVYDGQKAPYGTALLADENTLILGTKNKKIEFLNLETKDTIIFDNESSVDFLSLSNGLLTVGSRFGRIKVWDFESKQLVNKWSVSRKIYWIEVTNSEKLLLGNKDGTIDIYKVKTGEFEQSFEIHSCPASCFFVTSENKLISGARNGEIVIWNLTSNSVEKKYPNPTQSAITGFLLIKNKLFSSSDSGEIKIWDLTTDKCEILKTFSLPIYSLGFGADGIILWVSERDKIMILDLETKKCGTIQLHEDYPINQLWFSNEKGKIYVNSPTTLLEIDFNASRIEFLQPYPEVIQTLCEFLSFRDMKSLKCCSKTMNCMIKV